MNLSQSVVDSLISAGLAGYVSKSYVDGQDAFNATKTYIDTGDGTRLRVSQVNAASGAAGLDSTGRIDSSRLQVSSTQRWPKPFTSPSAYNASTVTTSTTETQVYPVSITDPGFTYKLMVTGIENVYTNTDGQWPVIQVRVGSLSGQVIAAGNGIGETYHPGSITTYSTSGPAVFTVPTGQGWTNLDIIALGGGGAGAAFSGHGGGAGAFATAGLIYGTTLPGSTTTLNVSVGAGGTGTGSGSASVVSGSGITTVSGAGGGNGSTNSGDSPGQITFNGGIYVGGAAQPLVSVAAPGNAPGGGGGSVSGGGPAGPGAPGKVWLVSYNAAVFASASAAVLPTPLNFQISLTGPVTLYVTLSRRSSTPSAVSATTVRPSLHVVPIPA